NNERMLEASEFYGLGFDKIFFVSSMTGSGTGELLDAITDLIQEDTNPDENEKLPKFAIIGQPNVGKSSLLNALIGKERTIVSENETNTDHDYDKELRKKLTLSKDMSILFI